MRPLGERNVNELPLGAFILEAVQAAPSRSAMSYAAQLSALQLVVLAIPRHIASGDGPALVLLSSVLLLLETISSLCFASATTTAFTDACTVTLLSLIVSWGISHRWGRSRDRLT
jgi:hypothetical protein